MSVLKKILILSAAVLSVVALTACQVQNAGASEEIQLIQSAEDDKDGDFVDYYLKSVSDGTCILCMSSSQQTDEANYEEFRELESYLKLISAK